MYTGLIGALIHSHIKPILKGNMRVGQL